MARVGKTPGATASVNMYSLYDKKQKDLLVLTDLPGFGYAKLIKERQAAIIRTTEQYIYQRSTNTKTLALGILLLDIRRTPSPDDMELLETLYDMNVPILVVVTKCDKVSSKYEREQLLHNIQNELQLPQLPLSISSMTGENINLLWQIIFDACDTCVQQMKQIYEEIVDPSTTTHENDNDEYLDDNAEDDDDDDDEPVHASSYDSWYDEQDPSTTKYGANSNKHVDDDDDIEYDQGFDWMDDNTIMLDDDNRRSNHPDQNSNDPYGNYHDDFDHSYENHNEPDTSLDDTPPSLTQPRVTLKSLKRRVKKMQRRGEI